MRTRFEAWLRQLFGRRSQRDAAVHAINPVDADSNGINEFAFALHRALGREHENVFFSPLCIRKALGIALAGAKGRTAQQIFDALRLSNGAGATHRRLTRFLTGSAVGADDEAELIDAGSLWLQDGMAIEPEFLEFVRQMNHTEIRTVDLRGASDAINDWVADKTRSKIREIVAPGSLDPYSRLVIINAVYFKGAWVQQFVKGATHNEIFFLGAGQTVRVQMMRQRHQFPYFHGDGCQMIELGYGASELSMLVILPDEPGGVDELGRKLSGPMLSKWLMRARSREVRVFLPRFKLSWDADLRTVLATLGMTDAFAAGTADFSGINGIEPPRDESLYLSAVLHKAMVDVDERGTEASAATSVVAASLFGEMKRDVVPVFRADHPFLFAIRSRRSGAILFLGRVMDPSPPIGGR